jgi:hypothetical protein
MMYASQIHCTIDCEPDLRSRIVGVYSSDTLPWLIRGGSWGCIVNTDPTHLPGTHWTAFYFNKNKGEFFDSFGKPPEYYYKTFVEFLKKHSIHYVYNSKCLQSVNAKTCGFYCLYYLLQKCKTEQMMNEIVNQFSDDKLQNDVFVYNFICKYFRYCTQSCMSCKTML